MPGNGSDGDMTRFLRTVVCLALVAVAAVIVVPGQAQAGTIRNFDKVFGTQANGAVRITGNSLMNCGTTAACRAVLDGGLVNNNNNAWNMVGLDADTDASTASSSGAAVTVPDGATVLYAGLFWGAARKAGTGGADAVGDPAKIRLKVPGGAAYQTVTASKTDYLSNTPQDYSSYADITTLVKNAGRGQYWGADIPFATGADRYAGWSIVVAYEDPTQPLRDLSVFNGYAQITNQDVLTTSISGFLAPPRGAVNAKFGMVTYEGDAGITGDYFKINGASLADASSPSTNFFGSHVTADGANLTDRTPASVNNLGIDAKVIDAAGMIPNGATSANLTFGTNGDFYYPAALTTQIDLYAPQISGTKSVTNLAGNEPAKVGDTLEYTLSFANTGSDDSNNSVISDPLPPNTTYVPGSLSITAGAGAGAITDQGGDDRGEYDAGTRTVRFRVGSGGNAVNGGVLGTGDNATVRFRVTADTASVGTTLANTAVLDYVAATINKPYTYRAATVRTPVAASADLSITKTGTPDPVSAGAPITYTLQVRNAGPSTAQDVVVTDTLPDGVDLVSTTPACTPSGQRLTCDLGSIDNGVTRTITVQARVPATSELNGITNVASVSTSTSDPNLDDNTSSAGSTVNRSADLSMTKQVSDPSPVPGQAVTFTLTARNNGPSQANGIRIVDSVPAAFAVTGATTSTGTCTRNDNDVVCTAPTLAPGASVTVQITARLDSGYTGGPLANSAKVISQTPDPSDTNNTGTVPLTPAAPSADLVVAKQTLTDPVVAGQPVSYRITVRNAGPSDARTIQVTDDLPAALTGATADSSAGTCAVASGTLTCALGDLTAGGTATVNVTATVSPSATGTLANSATATSPTADPSATNNTGTATDPVTASADLLITKTAQPSPVIAGQPVTYTLTVRNAGPSDSRGVTVRDAVPAPLTYTSSTASQGTCSETGGVVDCALGTVPAGGTATVTVVAGVPAGTPPNDLDNTATVDATTPDPDRADNTATYTLTTTAQANLTMTKTVSPDPVIAGRPVTYTLTVRNTGPSDAQVVQARDVVPSAITGLSASSNDGTPCGIAGQTVTCTRPTLANGAQFVVTITGTVAPSTTPGELTNTATATAQTPPDPTSSDNTAQVPVTVVAQADLALTKSGPATAIAGNQVTYTLTVTNNGPSTATQAGVVDQLPEGMLLVRGSGPGGDCTETTQLVSCPVGTLTPGQSQTITLVAQLDPEAVAGTLTNSAQAFSATPDPTDGNNTATADTTVTNQADLSITKVATPDPLTAGSPGTYTLTIHNDGPSVARDVVVSDPMPAGVTAVDADSGRGPCDIGATVTCRLGALGSGANAVVVISVRTSPDRTGSIVNTATVDSSTPDPTPGNGAGTSTTPVVRSADLQVTKSSDPSPIVAGSGVTYTITVTNNGPSSATGTTVADTLPAGLTSVMVDPSAGTCDVTGQTVSCALGTLEPGTSAVVTVTAALDPAYADDDIANTVTTDSDVDDPDPDDNTTTNTTPVIRQADLSLHKSADPTAATPGEEIRFGIVAANAGPSAARDVVITDTLPAGLTVTSTDYNGTPCAVSGQTVTCSIGDVPVGQVVVLITARLASGYDGGPLSNTATADTSTPDPQPGDNGSTVPVPAVAKADLSLVKTMSPQAPTAGSRVTYRLTVHNNGPSDAKDVFTVDELPRGLRGTRIAAPAGTRCVIDGTADDGGDAPEAGVVTCRSGTLVAGDEFTIVLTATVTPGFAGSLTNLARTGSDTPDPNVANNQATVTGQSGAAADISVTKTASSLSVARGAAFSYLLIVRNTGPSTARNVVVTDDMPGAMELTGAPVASAGSCVVSRQKVTCTIAAMAPGSRVTVRLPVRVAEDTDPGSVTNRATATTSTPDSDPGDNADTVAVDVTEGMVTPTPPPTVSPTAPPADPGADLPGTGSPVGLLAGGMVAVLLLAGAVLLVVARRRSPGRHG